MSVNDTTIRAVIVERRRRMRSYPEGNDVFWNIIEYGFVLFCVCSIVICACIAGGVK